MTNLYYDNRLGCGYADIHNKISNKCLEEDDSGDSVCGYGNYAYNLSSVHIIESMGQAATLSNAVKEFTLDVDKDQIYEQMLLIGKSGGSMFAYAFDV